MLLAAEKMATFPLKNEPKSKESNADWPCLNDDAKTSPFTLVLAHISVSISKPISEMEVYVDHRSCGPFSLVYVQILYKNTELTNQPSNLDLELRKFLCQFPDHIKPTFAE